MPVTCGMLSPGLEVTDQLEPTRPTWVIESVGRPGITGNMVLAFKGGTWVTVHRDRIAFVRA